MPVLTPKLVSDFFVLGKILSHGFVLVGYFPLCLSQVCGTLLISGQYNVSDEMLLSSFFNYIDSTESNALKSILSGNCSSHVLNEVIIPMLSRFNTTLIPTITNVKSLIESVARFTLISQPYYALMEMRRGMLSSHRCIWESCDKSLAVGLYNALSPTSERVWGMIVEPLFKNVAESRVFDFLRRFLLSCSKQHLCNFLLFVTGKPQCGLQSIQVNFHVPESDFRRRPTSSTCSMTVSLPATYDSFNSFEKEFTEVLNNSHMWSYDAL